MPKNQNSHDVLVRAIEIVDEKWGQGSASYAAYGESSNGKHCMLSAIGLAETELTFDWHTNPSVIDAIWKEPEVIAANGPINYNDAQGQTKENVIALLRRVAEKI